MNLRLSLRRQAMSRPAELSVTVCTGKPGRVCPSCGGSLYGRMPCKRRICPSYAPLWASDWRIVLLENLIAYASKAVLYTLIAARRGCPALGSLAVLAPCWGGLLR